MLKDFFSLLFPSVCMACGKALISNEGVICMYCQFYLPKTNYHLQQENPVAKVFWGRANVESATAYYTFTKRGKVQKLIHELKYRGQTEVGLAIGDLHGLELKNSDDYSTIDIIIPVPLHKKKFKKRGYNQSEYYAEGLGKRMNVPTDFTSLCRITHTDTQTKKTRYKRWKNVETIFKINDGMSLRGKHILLVDDVITTGATMEACIQALLKIPGVKVSVAAIAFVAR